MCSQRSICCSIDGLYRDKMLDRQSLDNTEKRTKNSQVYKIHIKWSSFSFLVLIHAVLLYWIYLLFTLQAHYTAFIFHYPYGALMGFGITAGAHRLWAHRSYTANVPLRVLLMLLQTGAMQGTIFKWVRDHRLHHKFTDTDADPYNSKRGFFFSHIGWLMCDKHPQVLAKGKGIDMSDVLDDPVVMFQIRHFPSLIAVMWLGLPIFLHCYLFGASLWIATISRIGMYTVSLNWTWLVNSAAHIYGMKPYDKSITPTENKFVSLVANGEGWHNYHHVFPWDYKSAELGDYSWNFTTALVDFMAAMGWASNLKTASDSMIKNRRTRTGVM